MTTRKELADLVKERIGLKMTKPQADELVKAVFDTIADLINKGESVSISRFGVFEKRKRRARMGRNPGTGEQIPVSPRFSPAFKASSILKKAVM